MRLSDIQEGLPHLVRPNLVKILMPGDHANVTVAQLIETLYHFLYSLPEVDSYRIISANIK
ncbi:hypothetical protein D3C71_2223240 [compost metagenome]